jgi:hypothetical protein
VISRRALAGLLLGLAAVFGLASCAVTDTTQYYTLGAATAASTNSRASASTAASTEPRAGAATSRGSVAGSRAVGVGVGPVVMPAYLDRT